MPETRSISPAGAKPGGQFEVSSQQHVIKYRYGYKNNHGEDDYFDCFVRFTVEGRLMHFSKIISVVSKLG